MCTTWKFPCRSESQRTWMAASEYSIGNPSLNEGMASFQTWRSWGNTLFSTMIRAPKAGGAAAAEARAGHRFADAAR